MLDLLNFQEKLENHVSVLNSPRISVPLQYLHIGVGLVNGHGLYGGRFGIISAKSEGLYPLPAVYCTDALVHACNSTGVWEFSAASLVITEEWTQPQNPWLDIVGQPYSGILCMKNE